MGERDFPWPVSSGSLLRDDLPDWQHNACLNPYHPDLGMYAQAYREGARQLTKDVITGKGIIDLLVFPIVFLYRHSVEVAMKGIIRAGNRLLDTDEDLEVHHRLDRLWRSCRRVIERIEDNRDLFDVVEEKVLALHALDPDSSHFRYPAGKSGERLLPESLQRFNVRHFSNEMEQLANFFSAVSDQIEVYIESKDEMEREYGP